MAASPPPSAGSTSSEWVGFAKPKHDCDTGRLYKRVFVDNGGGFVRPGALRVGQARPRYAEAVKARGWLVVTGLLLSACGDDVRPVSEEPNFAVCAKVDHVISGLTFQGHESAYARAPQLVREAQRFGDERLAVAAQQLHDISLRRASSADDAAFDYLHEFFDRECRVDG